MDERKCRGAKTAAVLINLDEELLSNNDDTKRLQQSVFNAYHWHARAFTIH